MSRLFTALYLLGGCAIIALFFGAGYAYRQHHSSVKLQRLREQQLLPLIQSAAQKHGLSEHLVRAVVWKESRFDRLAVGSKGEVGLMQITSGAVSDWARVNKCAKPHRRQLFAPELNLEIGCWYLALTGKHWEGYASQAILQLAEYNAGRVKVRKDWAPKRPEDVVTLKTISYPSTQSYIRLILDRKKHYEAITKQSENGAPQPSSEPRS